MQVKKVKSPRHKYIFNAGPLVIKVNSNNMKAKIDKALEKALGIKEERSKTFYKKSLLGNNKSEKQ